MGVKAIFAGSTVSPILAKRVAADTGVQVVPIYTDSLTPPGGEASSYIDLMRYDVRAIQEALR
jgi:ABC-type Zn uptake system ZnuABC Zn-binding protein ZnuA